MRQRARLGFYFNGRWFRVAIRVGSIFLLIALMLVSFCGTAGAHELSRSRFSAPLPLPLLFLGAGATVALTAVYLAVTEDRDDFGERQLGTISPATANGLRVGSRWLFFLLFVATLVAGLFGRQVPAENVATLFVWSVWLKGTAILSMAIGSPWQALSPWRTLYDTLCRLEGDEIAIFSYPEGLAEWPALVGFVVGVGIIENLTTIPRSPLITALLLAVYSLLMISGGIAMGPEWFRRADMFAVFYRMFSRISPVETARHHEEKYRVSLRPPWRECTTPVATQTLVGFIIATVYTVSFDGFSDTALFQTLLFDVRDATGLGPAVSILLYIAGYVGFLGVFSLVIILSTQFGSTGQSIPTATRALAPTILPIAAAYELAHSYAFVIENAAQLLTIVAEYGSLSLALTPLSGLSLVTFWITQVVLIIVGHVTAVIAVHQLFNRIGSHRLGHAHVPLTVLMIGYTVLSLWIISRPIA